MLSPKYFDQVTRLSEQQLREIAQAARAFKREAWFTKPRIITGHPVAHAEPEKSRISNFSTITKLVEISGGFKVFLVYRYPRSWVHSVTDNCQRLATGKPCAKPYRTRTWHEIFERKSLIPIIRIGVVGVVAMPYIPNWNLHDVLRWRVISLSADEVYRVLSRVAADLNYLHARDKVWGEPIVHNIILLKDPPLHVHLCDTEVQYYPWVSSGQRRMHDWFDFIFSACGSLDESYGINRAELAIELAIKIQSLQSRTLLAERCKRKLTLGQRLYWTAMSGRLSCSRASYEEIRQAVAEA